MVIIFNDKHKIKIIFNYKPLKQQKLNIKMKISTR